jgi:biofilm PGA synthesis N-glycosyltransferase PgaC
MRELTNVILIFVSILIIALIVPIFFYAYVPVLIGIIIAVFYELYILIILRDERKSTNKFKKKTYESSSILFIIIFLPIVFTSIIISFYQKESFIHYIFFLFLSEITTFLCITIIFPIPLAIKNKSMEKAYENNIFPPQLITVIIPAYNEELNLKWTIESVLQTTYPYKQIIIVDDGSKDHTYEEACKALKGFDVEKYMVLRKENGGKSSALNHGLLHAKGEIVVTIDSDSIIHRNALEKLVKILQEPNIFAVAGNPKVLSRVNLLSKCQQLEYTVGNIWKGRSSFFGVVTIVPGVLGAFNIKKIIERGKYDQDTMAEDFDLTLKLLKGGGQVKFCSDSIVYTQAPNTLKNLYNQRIRWDRGILQTIIKHKDLLKTSRHRAIANLTYPYLLLNFFAGPLLGIISLLFFIPAIFIISWMYLVLVLAGFIVLSILVVLISILLDDNDDKSLSLYAPFLLFGYSQFLSLIRIKSWYDVFLSKKSLKWTSVKRIKHRS